MARLIETGKFRESERNRLSSEEWCIWHDGRSGNYIVASYADEVEEARFDA